MKQVFSVALELVLSHPPECWDQRYTPPAETGFIKLFFTFIYLLIGRSGMSQYTCGVPGNLLVFSFLHVLELKLRLKLFKKD